MSTIHKKCIMAVGITIVILCLLSLVFLLIINFSKNTVQNIGKTKIENDISITVDCAFGTSECAYVVVSAKLPENIPLSEYSLDIPRMSIYNFKKIDYGYGYNFFFVGNNEEDHTQSYLLKITTHLRDEKITEKIHTLKFDAIRSSHNTVIPLDISFSFFLNYIDICDTLQMIDSEKSSEISVEIYSRLLKINHASDRTEKKLDVYITTTDGDAIVPSGDNFAQIGDTSSTIYYVFDEPLSLELIKSIIIDGKEYSAK